MNSSGTFLNGVYVGAPGYSMVGNSIYYGGALICGANTK
jgi:hypothetical protein